MRLCSYSLKFAVNMFCLNDKMVYIVRLGDVFIFINRQRTTMKLLHTEDGGLPLYIKRLEEETFHLPKYDQKSKSYPQNGAYRSI